MLDNCLKFYQASYSLHINAHGWKKLNLQDYYYREKNVGWTEVALKEYMPKPAWYQKQKKLI